MPSEVNQEQAAVQVELNAIADKLIVSHGAWKQAQEKLDAAQKAELEAFRCHQQVRDLWKTKLDQVEWRGKA